MAPTCAEEEAAGAERIALPAPDLSVKLRGLALHRWLCRLAQTGLSTPVFRWIRAVASPPADRGRT